MKPTHISKKSWLLGTAALALVASTPVYAQEADAPVAEDEEATLDTVIITGIRGSIQNSLNEKKNNTSIVEAISAEDIGKLPDLSIADSLARLPGVTAQRVRGRSQQISIRGLGPDFSLALLNGREVVSSGNNRGIEFDQFPSELIGQGIVYKTPDATLAATGIAGAVDLRTIRPLDYDERKINLSAQYNENENGALNPDFDEDGYRLFGSYIDQFADGKLGVALAVTAQSNPTQFFSRELKTNRFQTATDPATGLIYPSDNPRSGVVSREFERTSVAGTLEFEPTDYFRMTADTFYTDTEDAGIFRGVETPLASWATSNRPNDPGATFVGSSGAGPFATSATYSNIVPILRTDTEGNTAEIFAFGVNTELDATDNLTVVFDYGVSTLDRNDIDYESYAGTGGNRIGQQDTQTLFFNPDGTYSFQTAVDYTNPANVFLTDPGGWGQVGFIKQPKIEDELESIRLEARYDLENDFISGVRGGLLMTNREKSFDSNEAFLRAGANWVQTDPNDARTRQQALSGNQIVGSTNTGSMGMNILAYDPSSFLTDGTYVVEKATFDTEWSVKEDIDTWYAMADLDATLGQVPVRGNIGFQFVETTQASTGTLNFGNTQRLQTVTDEYTHFLPSLNLSFEVMPDTFIRAAAAQTLTRPRLDQLAANQGLGFNPQSCTDTDGDQLPDTVVAFNPPSTVCFGLGGGNPFLRPYESTGLDLAFEKYFDSTTALSLAVFHKDLSNWVEGRSTLVDATQIIQGAGLGGFLAANPEVATATLGGPVNFADGSITGFEATARVSMDRFLPETFAGFGVNASYTYADNGLETDNGDEITIPGYSESVWSGDIYYENHGFRARVSARYRDGFLSEVQNFDGSLSGADALEETIIDAQIGYQWDSGPLEGFSVNLEAFNLTDEPFVTENDLFSNGTDIGATFPSRHEQYGTTYNITIAKSF